MIRENTKKIATLGVIAAFGAILSYIEAIISFGIFIPGVKLGLANIAVVIALYIYGYKDALIINIVRIVVVGLIFGNLFSISFSIAGALISYIVMSLLKKVDIFSTIGVSVAGGVAHNVGQLLIATLIIESYSVINYLPVLMLAGIICGLIIGIVSHMVIKYLSVILGKREVL